tara:strand:- start:335 stop:685 length:351 start_codon:yes stop_codon:yes gene_type:complete
MGAKANIVVDQGSDFSTTITVRDNSGAVVNLTNYIGAAQIRKHYTSTTATSMNVVFETPRENGQVSLKLTRMQTKALAEGRYVYDVEVTDSANTRSRLVEGIVTVTPQVTRSNEST